jgi:hypothetical protein
VAYRGEEVVHGALVDVVEIVNANRERRVLFLDRESHRVVGEEQNQGSALRGPSLRRLFGDLRAVQGIVWPHHEERLLNGERTVTLTVRSVRTNSGIVPSVFRKPGAPAPAGHPRR